jgi:peptidoglycan/LPS O-acetylase OafA/YrhL
METKTSYIPALDGLRALSILLVFLGHVGLGGLVPGGLGVTTFFFISGYIITTLLSSEFTAQGTINLKSFYIRRILRLYPALLLMLILTTSFVLFLGFSFPLKELVAALFYFENYYFEAAHTYTTFHYQILWSLAVEEHFYLAFPFLLLNLIKRNLLFIVLIVGLIIVALVTRIFISYRHDANEYAFVQTYILTHCRFDSILYGCLLALIIHSDYKEPFLKISTSFVAFSFGLLLLLFTFIYKDDFFRQSFRYSLQGISLLIMVSAILFDSRYSYLKKVLSTKLLAYIGKLSYSIYLFHFLAEKISTEYIKDSPLLNALVMTVLTIMLSVFSYHIVEVPFLKAKKKFGSHLALDTSK